MSEKWVDPTDLDIGLSIAYDSLCRQIDKEITRLRDYLKDLSDEDLKHPETCGDVIEQIFYANAGLQKLASVLGYIDCWMDNGDPPNLSEKAHFE